MLLEKRENIKIVSALMGHAKVVTTLGIYSHVLSEVYCETANRLDEVHIELTASKSSEADIKNTDQSPGLVSMPT